MKKTTSFHLEEDILKMIEDYQKEHKLSSRNIALERMLIDRQHVIEMNKLLSKQNTTPIITTVPTQIIVPEEVIEEVVEEEPDALALKLDEDFENMPD